MRIHLAVAQAHNNMNLISACGRGSRVDTDVYRVDCLKCQGLSEYRLVKEKADAAKHEAFMAQVPRIMGEPWKDGQILCSKCNHDLFRVGDRTCYGHYANFHCANCGHVESRLTETGMSF